MPGYPCDSAGWMGGMMGGGWGGASWFGLLMLATILVVGLALAFSLSRRRPTGEEPMDILRRRYALGELTAEQFEAARKVLT